MTLKITESSCVKSDGAKEVGGRNIRLKIDASGKNGKFGEIFQSSINFHGNLSVHLKNCNTVTSVTLYLQHLH